MYIHRPTDLAFLAHPRTASRSTKEVLLNLGFTTHRGHHGGPKKLDDDRYNELRFFCTVRNHWDTFASWFVNKTGVEKDRSLTREWIEKWVSRHTRKAPFYCEHNRLFFFLVQVPGTIYLYYEHLDADLNQLLKRHGFPEVELPWVKDRRKSRDFQRLYTDEARDFVAWYFADEISEMGYTFEKGEPT